MSRLTCGEAWKVEQGPASSTLQSTPSAVSALRCTMVRMRGRRIHGCAKSLPYGQADRTEPDNWQVGHEAKLHICSGIMSWASYSSRRPRRQRHASVVLNGAGAKRSWRLMDRTSCSCSLWDETGPEAAGRRAAVPSVASGSTPAVITASSCRSIDVF